jgi:transposase
MALVRTSSPLDHRYLIAHGQVRELRCHAVAPRRELQVDGRPRKERFVDYAGDTVPVIVDRLTGEVHEAQIFVAVMGASNCTYVDATWTQALGNWIGAHTRALAGIGGVPRLIIPDNTKVAVIKACRHEPQVNRTYAEMAATTAPL